MLFRSWVACSRESTFVLRRASSGGAEFSATPRDATPRWANVRPPATAPLSNPRNVEPIVPAPARGDDAPRREQGVAPEPIDPAPDRDPTATTLPVTSLTEVISTANALANQRRYNEAIAACEAYQAGDSPDAELYFMMGMIHQTNGSHDRAEDCFHRALYLDSGHEEAMLALSLLAEGRGEPELAEHYRQSARRILERKAST